MHRLWIKAPLLLLLLDCKTTPDRDSTPQDSRTIVNLTAIPAAHVQFLGVLTLGQGSLIVFGSETDSLFVRSVVSTQTQAEASRVQVETIDKPDSLFVTTRPTSTASVDLQVEAPEKLRLHLTDEGRDVIVRNIENQVDAFRTGRGSLDIDDVEGPLTIQDGTGPIKIHDARGPLVINDEGGGIQINDVKNSVRIETGGGDVTIEQVRADVSVFAGPGNLTVRDVVGKVSYRKTGSGRVTIERVTGAVEKL